MKLSSAPFPVLDLYRLYAVFADPNADNAIIQPLKKELPFRELVKTQSWVRHRYKVESIARVRLTRINP